MTASPSRRAVLTAAAAGAASTALGPAVAAADRADPVAPGPAADDGPAFAYCLNTATVRGQQLDLAQQVGLAIEAGYDGIEPWVRDIEAYREAGGSLDDLRRRCADHGLRVPSAIGFAQWIVNDDAARAAGLEQMRREMELLRSIGGTRIAAPPVGAHREGRVELMHAAERYRAALEVGRETGIVPQVEVWGFSANVSRLGEAMFIAAEAGHGDACVLADAYHLFKGGSDPHGLKLLGRSAVHCFHLNDYPDIPRDRAADADRVYPGDGVAPLALMLRHFIANRCRIMLSLELFNPDYWRQDALAVAKTGLAKMRAVVAQALG